MHFVRTPSSKMRVHAGGAATCLMRTMVVSTFLVVSIAVFILVSVSNEHHEAQLAFKRVDLDGDGMMDVPMVRATEEEDQEEEVEEVEVDFGRAVKRSRADEEHKGGSQKVERMSEDVAEEPESSGEDEGDDEEVFNEEAMEEEAEEEREVEEEPQIDEEEEEAAPTTAPPVLEKRLPNCLIIGVRKGGTRPIIHFLTLHPQVVALGPELGFFSSDKYAQGLDWYKKQMPPVREDQVLIEKTADYFQSSLAPQRIHEMNSSIKLILVVRDPVERMISDYYFLRRYAEKHNVTNYRFMELEYSLEDLVYNKTTGEMKYNHGGLFRSRYSKFMKNWFQWFPKDQIHVVDGDAFAKNNPAIELKRLENFLGVKPMTQEADFYFSNQKGFWCLRRTGCMGDEKGHKFPKLDPKVEAEVRAYFKPFNQEFYRMMGHDYGWKQ